MSRQWWRTNWSIVLAWFVLFIAVPVLWLELSQ